MGGLQQNTVKGVNQKVNLEKSPLSTPGEVASPKERAPMQGLRLS